MSKKCKINGQVDVNFFYIKLAHLHVCKVQLPKDKALVHNFNEITIPESTNLSSFYSLNSHESLSLPGFV